MRKPFDLTLNEFDWITMERQGFTQHETAIIFGVKDVPGAGNPLREAHEKLRASAGLQTVLDCRGRGSSLSGARNPRRRMEGTK